MTDPIESPKEIGVAVKEPDLVKSTIDRSKITIAVAVFTTVAPLIPGIGPVLAGFFGQHPELLTSLIGALFGALHYGHVKGFIK